jgi:hypothetical protein
VWSGHRRPTAACSSRWTRASAQSGRWRPTRRSSVATKAHRPGAAPCASRVYWRNTDPTVSDRQFCDHGNQYRPAIFYLNPEQQRLAEESRRAIEEAGTLPGPVVTEITQAGPFYPAEDYHQDFYTKNPVRYRTYRFGCGRDARLRELWGETAGH